MRVGKLNRQVTIQHLVAGQDEIGQPVTTWQVLATGVWANVRHLSGVETIKADAQVPVGRASIRIRYRTDVTAAMQVVVGAKVYQIKAVLPDEAAHEFVDLACEIVEP